MTSFSPEKKRSEEMQDLYEKIKNKDMCETDFKRLYELTGDDIREKHGISERTNPCSVPVISEAVLKMAAAVRPCKILNVGMGGYPHVDLALAQRGFSVCGIEYSQSLTRLAAEHICNSGQRMDCLAADGTRLPFKNASFEAVLCSETVEHVPDDRAVIREIHRVLQPGGTFLFTVPCLAELLGLKERLGRWFQGKNMILHKTHLREYTYFSAKRLLKPYFRIEEWYAVPFTTIPFPKLPYENFLGLLVRMPILKHFSCSIAFRLKRCDIAI